MRSIILWIIVISLIILTTACVTDKIQPDKFQAELKNPDTFIKEYASKSINADESPTFDVNYRVCDMNELVDEKEQFWVVLFQLSLCNKTSKPLNDLQITAHFDENMQMILPNSTWYNEGIRLGAYSEKDYSNEIEYSWQALVDLISLGVLGGVDLDSFYDIYIEIEWEEGYEILHLDHEASKWDLEDLQPIEILDETTIEEMNILGYEQRIKKFGE